jgi:phosphoribosylglycinamide formyltransferase-1
MDIAVFASGNGTNFQAIMDSQKAGKLKARVALLVCDQPKAFVLQRAKKARVEAFLIERKEFASKEDYETAIVKKLKEKGIVLIALAGYMRIVGPVILAAYKNRILNIHPALLPSFKGTEGITDAFEYGVKVTGPTVHFVDEQMDNGPIIAQEAVKVEESDTLNTLTEKVHKAEHRIYPEAIRLFAEGKLKIRGRKVVIDGR